MSESYHAHQLSLWSTSIEHTVPDCVCAGKQCSRCPHIRCLGNFHRWSRSKDGYRAMCKICRKAERETEEFKAHRRTHHKENAEHINETKRAWYHANLEKRAEYDLAYRTRHPEGYKARQQRGNTSEKGKRRYRRYTDRHPERRQAFGESWRQRNPERLKLHAQVRTANRRARKLQTGGSFTTQQWKALKAQYDYTCLRCGKREPEIKLSADHVIPLSKGGDSDISNIQPLCTTCNTRKYTKTIDYRLWI